MAKYEVDSELELWLDANQGASGVLFDHENTHDLLRRAMQEAFNTAEGRELRERAGHSSDARLVEELAKRFMGNPFFPGIMFRSRVEEVIHDLLFDAPPAPIRSAEVNKHGVNLNFEAPVEKAKPTDECQKFAKAYNFTVKKLGIAATKTRAGIVTLVFNNDVPYEWPAEKATRLLNQGIAFGLIE